MNDPIVDEVRKIRDAHAARFDYDLDAIFRDVKEREKRSGLKFVGGVAHQPAGNDPLRETDRAKVVNPQANAGIV